MSDGRSPLEIGQEVHRTISGPQKPGGFLTATGRQPLDVENHRSRHSRFVGIPKGSPFGASFSILSVRAESMAAGGRPPLRSGKKAGKKRDNSGMKSSCACGMLVPSRSEKTRRPKAGRRREGKSYDRANLLAFRFPSGNGNNKNPGCLREYGPDGPPPSAVPGRTGPQPGAE